MMEYYETQHLQVRQRLHDIKQIQSENLGGDKMLDNLKKEVRKNREMNEEIIGRELDDKSERLKRILMILDEPATTQSEVERLTSDTMALKRHVQQLEEKIRKTTPEDDKLAFFKTQASGQAKKKEQKYDEIKKLEQEKMALERLQQTKEVEYAKAHGGNYMKRDDFKEFAVKLRGKNNNYRQMKKVLGEIKAEVNVLTRTEAILKGKASNLDEFYKNLEKEHGVEGYGNVAEKMEDLAENQQKMDSKKDETLQEITKIVTEIEG